MLRNDCETVEDPASSHLANASSQDGRTGDAIRGEF